MAQLDKEALLGEDFDEDRRRYRRMNCNIPVSLDADSYDSVGKAINLSAGGCFVSTDSLLDIGSSLDSMFELPYTLAKLSVEGKVKRHGSDPSGMALEFLRMTDDDEKLLEQYIKDFSDEE